LHPFFCLLYGSTYVKLNKICFVIFRFFLWIITYLLIFSQIKLIEYRRFCIGNLGKKFYFLFLSTSGRQRLAILVGHRRLAILPAKVIGDFALWTLENILFSFSLLPALNEWRFRGNGRRTGQAERYWQTKIFPFIDMFRLNKWRIHYF